MPAAELQRSATYFRSMATGLERTIQMAVQDLAAARAAAREGDKSHPLTPNQALAIKCELQREHHLWVQLAEEIDNYLEVDATHAGEHENEADLFTTGAEDPNR